MNRKSITDGITKATEEIANRFTEVTHTFAKGAKEVTKIATHIKPIFKTPIPRMKH